MARATAPGKHALVDVVDLSIVYESRLGNVLALDSVSLSIEPNKLIGIVGESGCGKTTLGLSVIGLLPTPPARHVRGDILYKGTDLVGLDKESMRLYRGTEIAMVFQEPMTSLNPVHKIGKQIEEAIRVRESRREKPSASFQRSGVPTRRARLEHPRSRSDLRKEVIDALDRVRIPDPGIVANRYPFELSGGMRQRVMIAMALAQKPSLLIADEPTTAVDVTTQAQILKLMKNLMDEVKTSILLITHDLALAAQVADRVAVMYGGQVVEEADVFELFSEPLHPYTQGLLACIPYGSKHEAKLKPIEGTVLDLRSLPPGCKFAPRCPRAMDKCLDKKFPLVAVKGSHKVACYLDS